MQVTIRMPDEYDERIKQLADAMGLKKSDIARLALRKFIDESLGQMQKKPYEKSKHLIGIASSGVADLGLNHRKHLVQRMCKDRN
jgi:hypothetical protein